VYRQPGQTHRSVATNNNNNYYYYYYYYYSHHRHRRCRRTTTTTTTTTFKITWGSLVQDFFTGRMPFLSPTNSFRTLKGCQ